MLRLSKFILITGLPVLVICTLLASWMYRIVAFDDLKQQSLNSHLVLTKTMANVIWPQISGLIKNLRKSTAPQSLNPKVIANSLQVIHTVLDQPIRETISGTNVLKVKLFDLNGLTFYSTDIKNVGKLKPPHYPAIANARKGEVTTAIELRKEFKSYKNIILYNRYVLSSYLPIYSEENTIEGVFEIYSDVTDIYDSINTSQLKFASVLAILFLCLYLILYYVVRKLESEIKKNNDLAVAHDSEKNSNKAKRSFMANMSHELRTPLNAIIGYSELLEEEAEESGKIESLQDLGKIQSAAKQLLNLINEILDLSKIEAGHMEIYTEDVELHVFIDEIIAFVDPLLNKNNNRIKLHFAKDITTIHTDMIKLRQVFFNLISNSTKFTKNGEITLTTKKHDDQLMISVKDTGIGIAEDQLEQLFTPFSQADESTTRLYGGTGLGLAITKQFCEMLGGSITVESEIGKGSTFTVTLPLSSTPGLSPSKSEMSVQTALAS